MYGIRGHSGCRHVDNGLTIGTTAGHELAVFWNVEYLNIPISSGISGLRASWFGSSKQSRAAVAGSVCSRGFLIAVPRLRRLRPQDRGNGPAPTHRAYGLRPRTYIHG